MLNYWETTLVDMGPGLPSVSSDDHGQLLSFAQLTTIVQRIKDRSASQEDRARLLVLAEALESEATELTPLADQLRALAALPPK